MEPTQYRKPIEPTQPAYHHIDELPNPYEVVPVPPPPVIKKRRVWLIMLIVALIVFAAESSYIIVSFQQQKSTAWATPIPSNYTATDIFKDILQAGAHPARQQQGISVYAWTNGSYSDIYADIDCCTEQSSITWSDVSSCSGPCNPTNYGLWVYASASDTQKAYTLVSNEMLTVTPTSQPSYPTDPSYMVDAGRCLLLGANAGSVYAQVIQRDCV